MSTKVDNLSPWRRRELAFLVAYAIVFYAILVHRSLHLSRDHHAELYGLRSGWLANRLNDVSDAQWRNFRGNLHILTVFFGIFTLLANMFRAYGHLQARGMSVVWLFDFLDLSILSTWSLHHIYPVYCIGELFTSKDSCFHRSLQEQTTSHLYFGFSTYLSFSATVFMKNIHFPLLGNAGHTLTTFEAPLDGRSALTLVFLLLNSVILRMISFGYDYHWTYQDSRIDSEKHVQRCYMCKSGKTCYHFLQERSVEKDKFSFSIYLSYLVYAPLYIAGPIISFNAFASQLDVPQTTYSIRGVAVYGMGWLFNLFLMELITHFLYYNAFAISGSWKQLSPMDVFIIGYGVLNFMWLKFLLIWRYFLFWSLMCGIESPENMPRCINNCYNLESFWKNWHASFNKWLVRYLYIPLGGSQKKLLNVWVIFTFVAIWHDLEWKLLSWAWLTCLFFVPEMIFKTAANVFKPESTLGEFVFREFAAIAGAVTITCLMVANLVGYVIGPSGINWLISRFLTKEGLPTLGGMFFTFYVGTKLMFHIMLDK